VNVLGLLNVLEASIASGVRRVVFASSGATYGNPERLPIDEDHPQRPESPYGITKMSAEHYLAYFHRDNGLEYMALRYGNVYGPRQNPYGEAGVVAIFTRQLLDGKVPTIDWDGEQVRDYVFVSDVAGANLAAMTAPSNGCVCIGTGVGSSVNRVYALLSEAVGTNIAPKRGPRRAGDLRAAYFNIQRARDTLGWAPIVPLEEGLARTVDWFRCQQVEVHGR
jgi:UDP-glucose 4-epimerase